MQHRANVAIFWYPPYQPRASQSRFQTVLNESEKFVRRACEPGLIGADYERLI